MAFRQGDQGDLGKLGAIAVAKGLLNIGWLAEAYGIVHKKK